MGFGTRASSSPPTSLDRVSVSGIRAEGFPASPRSGGLSPKENSFMAVAKSHNSSETPIPQLGNGKTSTSLSVVIEVKRDHKGESL